MESLGSKALLILVVLLLALSFAVSVYENGSRKLRELPPTGTHGVFASYKQSFNNWFRVDQAVKEGCVKFGDALFSFPLLGRWCVMVKSKKHLQDMYNAPEVILSMEKAAEELLQLRYTVGEQFVDETYHIPTIRSTLNQTLFQVLPELLDEVGCAFEEEIGTYSNGWKPVKVMEVFGRVISRASNRVFVGLPLCRNREYIELVRGFSNTAVYCGAAIKFLVPPFFRPYAGRIIKEIFRHHERISEHLKPLIEERMRLDCSKNDMLTWLMAEGEHSVDSISMRMLNVNFVALHTTTKVFTHAVYHLASEPSYVIALRAEVEAHLDPHDTTQWNKDGLSRCVVLDSFLKECLRLNPLGALWMPRYTVADFTFSDGTTIPAGNFVAAAVTAIHHDESGYPNPLEFDGFRFSNVRGRESASKEEDWMYRSTGTSSAFLSFGGGRHICPGRFFASLEMKCLLAYLVLHYDIKMPVDEVRPPNEWMGPTSNPARNATVLFRNRKK